MKVNSLQMQQTSKHTTAYSSMHRSWSPHSCLEALTMPLLYLHVFEIRTSVYWYVICSYLKACKCCKNWIQQIMVIHINMAMCISEEWYWFTSLENVCGIVWTSPPNTIAVIFTEASGKRDIFVFLESHVLIGERGKWCQADGGRCGIWKQSSSPPVPSQYFLNRTTFGKTQCVSSAYWIK